MYNIASLVAVNTHADRRGPISGRETIAIDEPIVRLPIALSDGGGGIDKFNEIHFFSLFDHKRYVAIWNASNLDLGRIRNIYIYI